VQVLHESLAKRIDDVHERPPTELLGFGHLDILLKDAQSFLEPLMLFCIPSHCAKPPLPQQLFNLGKQVVLPDFTMMIQHIKEHAVIKQEVCCLGGVWFNGETLIIGGVKSAYDGVVNESYLACPEDAGVVCRDMC
jgi:hypothetical protein